MDWKHMSADQMEAIYNPRVNVEDPDATIARFTQQSANARESMHATAIVSEDLRYADGPLCTLDLYQPKDGAQERPLYVFVHGGYWRGLDKHDHSFIVPPLLNTGGVVANVNYDLCPAVTLDEIVQETIRAVRFCHANATSWGASAQRLTLIGHSAGAHLAARVLNATADDNGRPSDCISTMIGISGVYEPQVVLPLSVNEEAQISEASAMANDCITHPPQLRAGHHPHIVLWAGGDEPEGWIDQTRTYASSLRAAGIACEDHVAPRCDHFSVLEEAMNPATPEFALITAQQ